MRTKLQDSSRNMVDTSAKLLQKIKYRQTYIYKKYTECLDIQKTSHKYKKGDKSTTDANKLTLLSKRPVAEAGGSTGSTLHQAKRCRV